MPDTLNFAEFRTVNVARCESAFFSLDRWSPMEWGCAIAGETGEACNLLKKMSRGDAVTAEDVGKELADIVTYCDLLAARLGLDLGALVRQKFNEVSERKGSDIRLPSVG